MGIEPDADVLGAMVVRTLEQDSRGGAVLDERDAMPTGGFVRFTQFVFGSFDDVAVVEFWVLVLALSDDLNRELQFLDALFGC